MGYVVANVVYIFGMTPPLKLLQAYQITLTPMLPPTLVQICHNWQPSVFV